MQRLRKLLRLPVADGCLLVEATIFAALARIAILTLPFRWIAPWLGRHTESAGESGETVGDDLVRQRVGWAVQVVSRHTPWQSKCLVQSIVARLMLGRRGVAGTIYLGLAKDPDGQLIAHAWLRSGAMIVTGRRGMLQFTVLSSFAFGTTNGSAQLVRSNVA